MAASPHVPFFDPESPVFRAHEGGKLGVHATKPLEGREDLALLYTPGVAEVSLAIAADPALSMRYTARGNTVAVISDGTAVLGLGDIGPLGAMPVMEGKAVLFKHFAGIDAVPVVMETGTVEELVEAIARIAPSYGGINLEDISAPRCFDIEEQLKERLDIPVFHDDQHGTAIVVLAGLLNAAKVLGRRVPDLRVVVSGAGAAGVAVTRLLQRAGVRDVVVCDSRGIISPQRQDLTGHKSRLAASTNPRALHGRLGVALEGADVFVGVSGGQVPEEEIASMAPRQHGLRAGEPDARGAPRRGPAARGGRRHRSLGLPEPDQQRARVPRHLPRGARRRGHADHRGDEARGGARHRRPRARAERRLHRAVGVPGGRRRGRRGRGAGAGAERRPPRPADAGVT